MGMKLTGKDRIWGVAMAGVMEFLLQVSVQANVNGP